MLASVDIAARVSQISVQSRIDQQIIWMLIVVQKDNTRLEDLKTNFT